MNAFIVKIISPRYFEIWLYKFIFRLIRLWRVLIDLRLTVEPVQSGICDCVAVFCSVLPCVAVCCSVLQCVALCCSVLQCVAVCCSQESTSRQHRTSHHLCFGLLCHTKQHNATHCNTLQHNMHTMHWSLNVNNQKNNATHCSILQHTSTHCNTACTQCIALSMWIL